MMEEIKASLRKLLLDGEFMELLQEVYGPGIEAAVERAMEQRDAKLASQASSPSSPDGDGNCVGGCLLWILEIRVT